MIYLLLKIEQSFFDFILPVIPVIDSSNSYDKLLEHFGQAGPLNSNGKIFLNELDDFFPEGYIPIYR